MSEPTRAAVDAEEVVEAEAKAEWLAEVERQLEALGRDILGRESSGRRLTALCEEIEVLACVVAWHHEQGNITAAAERRGTSRKVLRERVKVWAKRHPQLVPDRPQRPGRPQRAPSSEDEETKQAQAREKHNARQRARRAKLRAEKSSRTARDGVEATADEAAGRP